MAIVYFFSIAILALVAILIVKKLREINSLSFFDFFKRTRSGEAFRDIEPAPLLTPTQEPTFGETVGASLSFKYSPVIDFFRGGSEFGFAPLPEENSLSR